MKHNSLRGRRYQKKQKPLTFERQYEIMGIITIMDIMPFVHDMDNMTNF